MPVVAVLVLKTATFLVTDTREVDFLFLIDLYLSDNRLLVFERRLDGTLGRLRETVYGEEGGRAIIALKYQAEATEKSALKVSRTGSRSMAGLMRTSVSTNRGSKRRHHGLSGEGTGVDPDGRTWEEVLRL